MHLFLTLFLAFTCAVRLIGLTTYRVGWPNPRRRRSSIARSDWGSCWRLVRMFKTHSGKRVSTSRSLRWCPWHLFPLLFFCGCCTAWRWTRQALQRAACPNTPSIPLLFLLSDVSREWRSALYNTNNHQLVPFFGTLPFLFPFLFPFHCDFKKEENKNFCVQHNATSQVEEWCMPTSPQLTFEWTFPPSTRFFFLSLL